MYQAKKINYLNDNMWETHVYQAKKINYLNDNMWETHVYQAKKINYLNGFYCLNVNWFLQITAMFATWPSNVSIND